MTSVAWKQLRHVFAVVSGATPKSGNADYWDGSILWATPEDIGSLEGYWLRETRRKLTRAGYESCGTTIVPRSSIVLTKRAPIGHVAVLAEEACSNQGCFLLVPRRETDTRFHYYWLSAQADYLQILGRGSTFMELSTSDVKSLRIPQPSLEAQRAVADRLDGVTARLDALVAENERVLKLLSEKRRSIITRAVTSGPDYRGLRRRSRIPQLGKIPAHWKTVRLRFLLTEIQQGWSPRAGISAPSDDDWGVLKLNAVSRGRYDDRAAKAIPRNVKPRPDLEIQPGNVLVTRSNTPRRVGDACFVDETRPKLMLSDIIYRLGLRKDVVDGKFLVYFLTLPVGRVQIEIDARGTSASMVKISQEHIKNWRIPLPPLDEQRSIVATLVRETERIERAKDAAEHAIELIKERRAALIAAAVTGQVKLESVA